MKKLTKEELYSLTGKGIHVMYDGAYPNVCSGNLVIFVDNKEVYNKDMCCHSTGNVWIDENNIEQVSYGELIWLDADKFSEDIQEAVKKELDKFTVCCGGCI